MYRYINYYCRLLFDIILTGTMMNLDFLKATYRQLIEYLGVDSNKNYVYHEKYSRSSAARGLNHKSQQHYNIHLL